MALVARSAERVVGLFAYFIENGASVDSQTVSINVLPDADPISNWPSFGDVLPGAQWETETESDPYMQLHANRYVRRDVEDVVADYLTFQTRQMNGLVDRLQFGAAAAIVEGTAQSPMTVTDRFLEGWLLIQGRNLRGARRGQDDYRLVAWVQLRLSQTPANGEQALSPTLRAQILPAAANSIVFPAAA